MKQDNNRELYLDVLKGVAMIGVILVHFGAAPNSIVRAIVYSGARCPQLFFIISSFLTWRAMKRICTRKDYFRFLTKRFVRIGPVYYVGLLLALIFPVVTIFKHTFYDLLTHCLFINGLFPQWCDNIMHVEWYIADLFIFYLICPILYKIVNGFWSSLITFFVSIFVSTIVLVISNNILVNTLYLESSVFDSFFHCYFILHQLPVWMLGIVMFYFVEEKRSLSPQNVGGIIIILAIILVVFVKFHLNKQYLTSSLIAGLFFSLLFLICYRFKYLFHYGLFIPVAWIGKYSFGIYCFHQTIISILRQTKLIEVTNIYNWFCYLFIVLLLSSIFGFIVENQWIKIQKKIFNL